MDFEKVLHLIIKQFKEKDVNYALMGGFAVGVYGIMRPTVDLDFLVLKDDLPKIEEILDKYNYNRRFKSENASQYVSDVKPFGEIDFLHAFRKISLSMLDRAQEILIFEGKIRIKVLKPEDIIGLKVQAFANDNSRKKHEVLDIKSIMQNFKHKLDWELIKEYFYLFDKEKMYKDLKEKYGKVK